MKCSKCACLGRAQHFNTLKPPYPGKGYRPRGLPRSIPALRAGSSSSSARGSSDVPRSTKHLNPNPEHHPHRDHALHHGVSEGNPQLYNHKRIPILGQVWSHLPRSHKTPRALIPPTNVRLLVVSRRIEYSAFPACVAREPASPGELGDL